MAAHSSYPETIPLPNGWQPEGIATDGDTFFAGSRATGSIWRGDLGPVGASRSSPARAAPPSA